MANIKSQIKRIKTSGVRRQRNKKVKSALKTYIDRFYEAKTNQNKDAAKKSLVVVSKELDKAVSKGIIHKNNAANKKSKMTKAYNQLIAEKPAKEAPEKEAQPKKQTKSKKKPSLTASTKKTSQTEAKKGK